MLVLLRVRGAIPHYVRVRMSALDAAGDSIMTADINANQLEMLRAEPTVLSLQESRRIHV